eukprot:TRINITY_DN9276_c0_g3_i1.p1 TRINITY_DN9276_c0_g3~~TRINITY_DN9276_c0_g3_i1.p1  ORF type:complete len:298 (-),score=15.29 TRINITY_DN9276_c0_g3_i1:138-1031(-)
MQANSRLTTRAFSLYLSFFMRDDSSSLLSLDGSKKISKGRAEFFFRTARKTFFELNGSKTASAWDLLRTSHNKLAKNKSKEDPALSAPRKIIEFIRNRSPPLLPTVARQPDIKPPFGNTEILSKLPLRSGYRIHRGNGQMYSSKIIRNTLGLKLEASEKRCATPLTTTKTKGRANHVHRLERKFQTALERSDYKMEYKRKLGEHSLQWLNNRKSYNVFNNSHEISKVIPGTDAKIDTLGNMHTRNPLEFHKMRGLTSYKLRRVREDSKGLRQALKIHPKIFHKTKEVLPCRDFYLYY